MRWLLHLILMGAAATTASAQTTKSRDELLSEALRDVHDRGRDLYNRQDSLECYRMFQGGLYVARGMLGHRPSIRKRIDDGLAAVERERSIARRAYQLHELIEAVRADLRSSDRLELMPREVKESRKAKVGVLEVKSGVVGRVLWKGQPVAGVEIMFVSTGRLSPRVFETVSGSQGGYSLADLPAGTYIVTIKAGPKADVKELPERYSTTTTSPLKFEVQGGGEKLDFVLQ